MATPNVGILTTAGKALIDKVNSGQAKIIFSKVVFSSMDNSQLSDTQIKALTAIAPQEVVVSSPQTTLDTNSGETRIRATGTNEKLVDGVYVKTYGVFAKDDTGNEILYGVTVSPNPNYFPAYDGVTPQAVTYSYKTVIQETSNITMTNSNDVYVSQEDLTEAIAKIPQPDLSGYDKTDDVDKKLQNKQDKLGYTAANDSTVVHTADMRKPANDVAGIEEVNAKQDKLTITPADDSKVVHNSGLSTMPADNSGLVVGNDGDIGIVKQSGTSGAFGVGADNTFRIVQSNHHYIGIADTFHDMFKVNDNYQISLGPGAYFTPADDSKVAHLSGANNFDTTPTVNNNPLLIASSLPSDLARTGQDANFTGKLQQNGQDVALANNTIARNPNTGVVSEPVDFTKLTVNGGKTVATSDDLKSLEASAWHTIALPDQQASKNLSLLYQVDKVNKQLKINLMGTFISATSDWKSGLVIADFGSIITSITSADIYVTFIKRFPEDQKACFTSWNYAGTTSGLVTPTIEFNGSKVLARCSDVNINAGYGKISVPAGEDFVMVNNTIHYDELV